MKLVWGYTFYVVILLFPYTGGGGTHIRFLLGARTRSPYMGGISAPMNIQKNLKRDVSLKKFTTFKIGGSADFFVRVRSVGELKEALLYAKTKKLKTFVLGGGSNTVFSDDGFDGLIIKMEIMGVVCRDTKDDSVTLEVGGGEVWDELVSFCVSQGFYGIENLSSIPGTVGAAPVQNIGAYGIEVKDVIEWVEAINVKTGTIKRFTNTECDFKYRDSFFKTPKGNKYIITRVCFTLKKSGVPDLLYSDMATYFNENKSPSLKAVREAVISIRSKKFPNLNEVGTAGSFFKNPILTNKEFAVLKDKFPDIPSYYGDKRHVKIPLGFVLDKLGWKGKKYTQVGSYEKQALIIVNYKRATRRQLSAFVDMIEKDVKDKTGIVIEKEVTFVE